MSDPISILLLHDGPTRTESLEEQLRRERIDFTFCRVATESGFRRELESGAWDVILADFHPPGFDGMAALRIARERDPDLPFIFVSGPVGDEVAVEALRQGATDYVLNDSPARLVTAITRALDEAGEKRRQLRLQHALLESEQRFQLAMQATHDVLWEMNPGNDTIWISGSIAAEMGWNLEDGAVPAEWYRERILPEDLPRVEAGIAAAIEGENDRWGDEFRFRRASGEYTEVASRAIVVRDGKGRAVRLVGTMRDITARRLAERRAEEAEHLAKLARWRWDVRSGLIEGTPELYRIYDVSDGGKTPFEAFLARVHPDDRKRVLRWIAAPQPAMEHEYRIVRGDGSERVVHFVATVTIGDDGQLLRASGIVQDVTERVESERRIRDLSRVNSLILENAGEGIIACDPNHTLLFANPAALNMLGWSEAPSDINLHQLIASCCEDRERCPITAPIRAGGRTSGRCEFSRRDHSRFEVSFTSSAMSYGARNGCVVVFQDITQRRRLEKQLEQAQRISSLGRVAATIAHEFNNVLMGIQPFAELVRKRAGSDEKLALAATQMLASIARGKRITSDILRTTQVGDAAVQPHDLALFLRHVEPQLRTIFPESVTVAVEVSGAPLNALCDSAQLQQVILNLAINARDAMPEGGRFTISGSAVSSSAGEKIRLAVRDTGTGIESDILPYIFEPLFTTKHSGTGLGLAVTQQIITRNQGSISVESTPGKGTTFEILLPAAAARDASSKDADGAAPPVDRILLIEDDEAVAAGLSALLEAHGVTVRVLQRAQGFEEAIEDFRPRAVILDLRLPDADGLTVFDGIAARWPDLPVVLSSGDEDPARVGAGMSAPNIRFLRKPYDIDALFAALGEIS